MSYVAVAGDRILGFATVAAGALERASLPSARLRRHLPVYPLPVLRLARLGVGTPAQGLGIGKALLRHVLGLAVDQRDLLGCVGVSRTRSRTRLACTSSLGFVPLAGVREGALHGDPTPLFLSIGSIAAAREL